MKNKEKPKVYIVGGQTYFGFPHPIVYNEVNRDSVIPENKNPEPKVDRDVSGERATNFALSSLED